MANTGIEPARTPGSVTNRRIELLSGFGSFGQAALQVLIWTFVGGGGLEICGRAFVLLSASRAPERRPVGV